MSANWRNVSVVISRGGLSPRSSNVPLRTARRRSSSAAAAAALLSISRFVHLARLTRTPRKLPHQACSQRSRARPPCSQILYRPTACPPFCSLRYSAEPRGAIRGVRDAARMTLEPFVNPGRLETDGAPAADANVMDFAPLARGVDRVPTDAGILGRFRNGQPGLHGPSGARPLVRRAPKMLLPGIGARARRA